MFNLRVSLPVSHQVNHQHNRLVNLVPNRLGNLVGNQRYSQFHFRQHNLLSNQHVFLLANLPVRYVIGVGPYIFRFNFFLRFRLHFPFSRRNNL